MVGAVEKQKLCYIMNRDAEARLTISSPLEAHKANTYTFNTTGIDVGFENPLFACLEMDYEETDSSASAETPSQVLTYYELDLGLNHVVRKYNEILDDTANLLIAGNRLKYTIITLRTLFDARHQARKIFLNLPKHFTRNFRKF